MTDIDTILPNLSRVNLGELVPTGGAPDTLAADRDVLVRQLKRARSNIGSGPPGRAD